MRLNRMNIPWLLAGMLVLTLVLPLAAAQASESELSYVSGGQDIDLSLETQSHYVAMSGPQDWGNRFAQSISLYGYRYGDVGSIKGVVVFWQAPADKTDITTPYTILGRKLFDLSQAPEKAGWFSVALDPVELPAKFGVSVFTYSNDQRGLKLGLTSKRRDSMSNSFVMKPDGTLDRKFKPNITRDGREWMLKLTLRSTLEPASSLTSAELSGSGFSFYDDGTADKFVTVQKHGMLLHFDNPERRQIGRVYVYAQAGGDWLKTSRTAAVSILNSEMGILQHMTLPYTAYTNTPSWAYVEVPYINAPTEFYVLVEPNSLPEVQLQVGVDTSSDNKASSWAVIGAHLDWETDAPKASSNWMVRVEYK